MFSNAVKLADLNDFLSPAQDCVKPIIDAVKGDRAQKVNVTETDFGIDVGRVTTVRPDLIKSGKDDAKAQVNLVDCLACSGCVTSAEAVLIEQQGVPDFLQKVKHKKFSAVSVSSHACVSLALENDMSIDEAMGRLTTLLKMVGVKKVYGMSESDSLSLQLAESEFLSRLVEYKKGNHSVLPVLTSHCPGWLCYAEKSLDSSIISHILHARPAQEIQGLIVKTLGVDLFNIEQLSRDSSFLSLSRSYLPSTRHISHHLQPLYHSSASNGIPDPEECSGDCHCSSDSCCSSGEKKDLKIESGCCSSTKNDRDDIFVSKELKVDLSALEKAALNRVESLLVLNRSSDTFHCVIQPCFDKKLEAARPEFGNEIAADSIRTLPSILKETVNTENANNNGVHLVDGVLATVEVLSLLEEVGFLSLKEIPISAFDSIPSPSLIDSFLNNTQNTYLLDENTSKTERKVQLPISGKAFASNGFGPYLLSVADAFFSSETKSSNQTSNFDYYNTRMSEIHTRKLRNKHISESILECHIPTISKVKMITATGFRNIQNILKYIPTPSSLASTNSVKQKNEDCVDDKSVLAVIEVLACPSGCLNGGGQLHAHRQKTASGSSVALPQDAERYLTRLQDALGLHERTACKWALSDLSLLVETLCNVGVIEQENGTESISGVVSQLRKGLDMILRSLKPKDENEITAAALKW